MHAVNQVVSQTRDIKILHNKCDIKTILKRVNKGWQHYGTEMKAIISWLLRFIFSLASTFYVSKVMLTSIFVNKNHIMYNKEDSSRKLLDSTTKIQLSYQHMKSYKLNQININL